ncbi:TPA: hypothetical protein QC364_000787 [Bacillus cereus]|nr:hypothetical protein [Bacillus cereus]
MTNLTNTTVAVDELTVAVEEKKYKRYDLQDESDFSIETLQEMREWLADFWNTNPDEDMEDEEHEEMIAEIMQADEDEMFDRLGGIDYSWCEIDQDTHEEIPQELTSMEQNFSWGYGIRLEKIDEETLQVTLKWGEEKEKTVWTTDLPETDEGWREILKEHAPAIREAVQALNRKPEIKYL